MGAERHDATLARFAEHAGHAIATWHHPSLVRRREALAAIRDPVARVALRRAGRALRWGIVALAAVAAATWALACTGAMA